MNGDLLPPARENNTLRISQQNLNKSNTAQQTYLFDLSYRHDADIACIQEPYIDHLGKSRANSHWYAIYPATPHTPGRPVRSLLLVKASLSTTCWQTVSDC
jgi:hypothetical protein